MQSGIIPDNIIRSQKSIPLKYNYLTKHHGWNVQKLVCLNLKSHSYVTCGFPSANEFSLFKYLSSEQYQKDTPLKLLISTNLWYLCNNDLTISFFNILVAVLFSQPVFIVFF